jgi:DNA-directed RNA polymerase specialized sigma24 family protein
LGSFRGDSRFQTWTYRIACNALLSLRTRGRLEQRMVSFDAFADDLAQGLSDDELTDKHSVDEALLLEEVKIGCTLAMLLCLDRPHRLAYIMGEIAELDHRDAAKVLAITPALFRKRLSRARASINSFMVSRCGLVNPASACRCRRRVATAIKLGRVDPGHLLFASSVKQAREFPQVLVTIRELEETRRAAALYRSHALPASSGDVVTWMRTLLDPP